MFNAELAEVDNRLATSVASNQKGDAIERKIQTSCETFSPALKGEVS